MCRCASSEIKDDSVSVPDSKKATECEEPTLICSLPSNRSSFQTHPSSSATSPKRRRRGGKKNHDPYSIHELISSMDPVETSLYVSLPCTAKRDGKREGGKEKKTLDPNERDGTLGIALTLYRFLVFLSMLCVCNNALQ